MIDTTDPTVAHLLAACIANPDELDCALRLADAIEAAEGGVPCPECPEPDDSGAPHPADLACRRCGGGGWLPHPRAEFIRAQCELESRGLPAPNDERTHELARREHELLRDHERAWRAAGKCEGCRGTGVRKPGGHSGTPTCPHCWEGDVGGLLVMPPAVLRDEGDDLPATRYSHTIRWRRGLIDRVEVPTLGECFERVYVPRPDDSSKTHEVWQPTPWLRAVVTHHPTVREVVALDRGPALIVHNGRAGYEWCSGAAEVRSSLPEVLFNALDGGDPYSMTPGSYRAFDAREAAVSALGRAVVKVARGGAA